MNIASFRGLLECPYHKGWIEFDYHSGDKILDLTTSIEDKWGRLGRNEKRLQFLNVGSWAFFCAQKDGSYLALRKNELIPTLQPMDCKDPTPTAHKKEPFFSDFPAILDVAFLDHRFWAERRDKVIEITANFRIDLPFKRQYKVPESKIYDVRLIALVAVVGG